MQSSNCFLRKQRDNKYQFTATDFELSQKYHVRTLQNNVFHSTVIALSPKCKLQSLNPIITENGVLRSQGRHQFAPTLIQIAKCPIIPQSKDIIVRLYIEHAHRVCVRQVTENFNAFIKQRFFVIDLRKSLLSNRFKCFLCRVIAAQNFQPIMATLPQYRYSNDSSHFPFVSCGIDFFGPFYSEEEKDNGLWSRLNLPRDKSCTSWSLSRFQHDTLFSALRRFCSRCQPNLFSHWQWWNFPWSKRIEQMGPEFRQPTNCAKLWSATLYKTSTHHMKHI